MSTFYGSKKANLLQKLKEYYLTPVANSSEVNSYSTTGSVSSAKLFTSCGSTVQELSNPKSG